MCQCTTTALDDFDSKITITTKFSVELSLPRTAGTVEMVCAVIGIVIGAIK